MGAHLTLVLAARRAPERAREALGVARAGAPVEIEGYERGVVTARVATTFASPTALSVRGPCDGLVYSPTEPDGHARLDARDWFERLGLGVEVQQLIERRS